MPMTVGLIAGSPPEVRVLGGGATSGLSIRALEAVLNGIPDALGSPEGTGKKPVYVVQTLRIAMQPDIPWVASTLLSRLDPEDALIVLMMDIRSTREASATS